MQVRMLVSKEIRKQNKQTNISANQKAKMQVIKKAGSFICKPSLRLSGNY